ncbi:Flp family type IVb pilin [Actinoplanes siamensis]|uniref:Pilus assembly protein Flp/PilA n=1 Tax=Actinoplanes siamensis TaxID=1223317 RepID=A0A919N4L4_9ACTN|nr:hypothetical protein [Actinoplanes siamensis]GIF04261.1 hypothetical protein Asi03nite_17990 [Actinoplanes siamensis]
MEKLNMLVTYLHARYFAAADDRGATVVEYSLLAAIVVGVCIAAFSAFGGQIASVLTTLTREISFPGVS